MRLRFVASILIFLSAYAPLSVIFLIQDFDFAKKELMHPWLVVTIAFISVLSCLILCVSVRGLKSSSPPVMVKSVSNRSGQLLNYSIPYMISFLVIDMGNLNLVLSFAFFMCILYWLTMKTHNVFINPVLAGMGYSLYNVRYERNGHDCEDVFLVKGSRLRKNERCRLVEISEQLFVVTERNPEV